MNPAFAFLVVVLVASAQANHDQVKIGPSEPSLQASTLSGRQQISGCTAADLGQMALSLVAEAIKDLKSEGVDLLPVLQCFRSSSPEEVFSCLIGHAGAATEILETLRELTMETVGLLEHVYECIMQDV